MATLESIQARIATLQARAEALVVKQSSSVLEKIRGLMEKHGITTADIDAHVGGKGRGRKPRANAAGKQASAVAKYRDPKTGATWTGHGRAPAWIAGAKNRARFLVDGYSPNPAPAAKQAAKAGNYVRGAQAPKYLDPKTGATWSGRGRAPAWLAGAKDRAKFLIAGANEGASEPKAKAARKAVPAKKTAGKKVAVKKSPRAAGKEPSKRAAAKRPAAEKAAVETVVAT